MKQFFFLLFLSISVLSAQNVVITSGHSILINTDASININGLKLTPGSAFTINGINNFDRSHIAITSGSNSSINRVFNATNVVNNFVGTLDFYYEDSELNGLDESLLELQVKDGSATWNSYVSTLDNTANIITHTFSTAISFTDITAAQSDASLSIESINFTNIRLFPNPTSSQLLIDYDGEIEVAIYNMQGQLLLTTYDKKIDMSAFHNAIYVLIINDYVNNTTNTYKIIKQ